jgi:hypothetical protein
MYVASSSTSSTLPAIKVITIHTVVNPTIMGTKNESTSTATSKQNKLHRSTSGAKHRHPATSRLTNR